MIDDDSLDVPDVSAPRRTSRTVLDLVTVLASLTGLILGIRLAEAGVPPASSVIGGLLGLPLLARLLGDAAMKLARRQGLLPPEDDPDPGARLQRYLEQEGIHVAPPPSSGGEVGGAPVARRS